MTSLLLLFDREQSRRLLVMISCVSIIGGLLLVSSCGGKATVSNASRALAVKIVKEIDPPEKGNSETSIAGYQVFLDASESMKGFVSTENRSPFGDLINDVLDALPNASFYKYGQKTKLPPEDASELWERQSPSVDLYNPDYYRLYYNPDDRLIGDKIVKDGPTILSVLITDGVYSDWQGRISPAVVAAFQKWIEQGGALGILIFKSAYKGELYSERARTKIGIPNIESRPFYAFVFSPAEKAITDLQKKLIRSGLNMGAIIFSDKAIRINAKAQENVKGVFSFDEPPKQPYYWQMLTAEFLAGKGPHVAGYKISCQIDPTYPVEEIRFDPKTDYYRWSRGTFAKVEEGPPQGFRCDLHPAKAAEGNASNITFSGEGPLEYNLTATFLRDTSSDYSFYHFKLNSGIESFRKDIIELSTRDDSAPANASKTYRFFELITAITEVHFKARLASQLAIPLFATVENH